MEDLARREFIANPQRTLARMAFRRVILVLFTLYHHVQPQTTCPSSSCLYSNIALTPTTNDQPNQHYYIGGLFGVHEMVSDAYACSTAPLRDRGIINLEAFMWAIKQYRYIHTGVSIGGVAVDTCSRYQQTLEHILGFETCKVRYSQDQNQPSPRNLLAYVGPDTSMDAMSSAMLLKDMNKTQVSYAAKSADLSTKGDNYPFFLRTVPSNAYEMKILATLLKNKVNVRYVQVLHAGDTISMQMFQTFKAEAAGMDICIVYNNKFSSDASVMSNVADAVIARQSTRYIVVLAGETEARMMLVNMRAKNAAVFSNFIFLGTSSWTSAVVNDLDMSAYATAFATPAAYQTDVNTFYSYLDNLKPDQNTWDPWYKTWWEQKLGCGSRTCDQNTDNLIGRYARDPYVPFTLAAVKSVIIGIRNGAVLACSTGNVCSNFLNVNNRGQQIYSGIVNATDGGIPFFTTTGVNKGDASNAFANFEVHRFKGIQGRATTIEKIGTYNPSVGLTVNITFSPLSNSCPNNPCTECNEFPDSTTRTSPVTTMSTKMPTTDPTEGGQYVLLKFLVSDELTGIYDKSAEQRTLFDTRFEIGQKWIIAVGVLAGLGILAVIIFEVYILYKLLGTRIGRQWRTMWLGQLLLLGIFLSYLLLFAYLPIPTDATCGITRFGVGVCYAIMFAVLLVKLMVILTSKSSESILADVESPNYLKGIYQFLMFTFAVGVQIVINVQWLIQVPPYAVKVTANHGGEAWICNHFTWKASSSWTDMQNFVRTPFENHLLSLTYIMALILITTIVAMKAHGIITNHRESVFIGIAAGFSIPIWIAWGLVGGLNRDSPYAHEYGDACTAFGLFTTATLCLFSLFLPKVRQLVNMGVEGIYLEDDRDTYYAGSVIMAPPSYKSRPSSMIYVNSQDYSNPVVIGNGDPNHLKHPGSMYSGHSAPVYTKRSELGSSKVLRVTGDLTGKHPTERKRPASEIGYTGYAGSYRKTRSESGGTLRKARSQQDLGAL